MVNEQFCIPFSDIYFTVTKNCLYYLIWNNYSCSWNVTQALRSRPILGLICTYSMWRKFLAHGNKYIPCLALNLKPLYYKVNITGFRSYIQLRLDSNTSKTKTHAQGGINKKKRKIAYTKNPKPNLRDIFRQISTKTINT